MFTAPEPVLSICIFCDLDTPHLWHWYKGCDCSRWGCGKEGHRGHCTLFNAMFVENDGLLVK